jgi:N4-gp56 family major capsid protein
MANVNTTTVNSQFQTFFSKSLLERQIPLLQMEQFAQKVPYPTKTGGNKTVRFFRFDNPSIASITTLTEGTSPTGGAGERQLTLSTVEATLEQFGSSIVLTDVLLATELFNHLAQATKQLGEDAALHADTLSHRALVLNTTASTTDGATVSAAAYSRFAQNGTNGTNFQSASVANAAMTALGSCWMPRLPSRSTALPRSKMVTSSLLLPRSHVT